MTENNLRALRVDEHMTVPQAIASLSDFLDAKSILVIGYDADGYYFQRSANLDRGDVLWLLEDAREDVRDVHD